jgi:selenoprotein W-related protein
VIEITYCRLCGWGLRAGWMAQELLTTFAEELGSVTLTPDGTGGVFEVRVNDEVIWSRKEQGRFPELKKIKQLIRSGLPRVTRRRFLQEQAEFAQVPARIFFSILLQNTMEGYFADPM